MNVVVLGGSGFLGSHVADKLSDAQHHVTVADKEPSRWLRPDQRFVLTDILDEAAVSELISGADVVFNFAGIADIYEANEHPANSVRYNVLGNVHVLEACKRHGVKRYVYASTLYVYSRAGGAYRCSKQASESYIDHYREMHGLESTILRYGSLYGPRSDERNGIHRFICQAVRDGRIVYHGTADALREYIHVDDAARASVDVLAPRFANHHVILSGGNAIRVADLFRMVAEILGKPVQVEYLDDGTGGHYETTPYSYAPRVGMKYMPDMHVDLGQGLLMKIEENLGR